MPSSGVVREQEFPDADSDATLSIRPCALSECPVRLAAADAAGNLSAAVARRWSAITRGKMPL